jgi:hypothetical protein
MSSRPIKTKVLITVMTYPHPSRGYQELVCTAGITENDDWVRLYPSRLSVSAEKSAVSEISVGRD